MIPKNYKYYIFEIKIKLFDNVTLLKICELSEANNASGLRWQT